MAGIFKLLAATCVVGLLAACAREQQTEEYVMVDPEPISSEPTYTGKYK